MQINRVEDQLIIHCARVTLDERRKACIRDLLSQPLDWQYITTILELNHITSLFARNLAMFLDAKIADTIRENFKQYYFSNIQRSLLLKGELARILRAFQNNNISAIPIKGPVLAEIVYKDIALREYGDLDILVRKGEYEQAIQLLLTLGYQETNYPSSSNSVWHRKYAHHRTFINERSGVFVEMHWDLTERNPALLEIDKIAPEHLIDIMFGGTTTQVLNPELTLLYLCVHGYRHQWERLSWLCDVAELINTHPNLDWELVYEQADKFHLESILEMGLFLVDDVLECPLPVAYRDKIRADAVLTSLAAKIERDMFSETSERGSVKRLGVEYQSFSYKLLSSPLQKLRYLSTLSIDRVNWTPNEADKSLIPLPRRLNFLYVPVRFARLSMKYSVRYLRLLYKVVRS